MTPEQNESEERLDEAEAIERLNAALSQQYRSALQYSIVAASLSGLEAQAVGAKLTEYGDQELSGARLLIEKIVSFGGEPTGREGRSEALEHMLEHQIMRKQEQVDFLRRAQPPGA